MTEVKQTALTYSGRFQSVLLEARYQAVVDLRHMGLNPYAVGWVGATTRQAKTAKFVYHRAGTKSAEELNSEAAKVTVAGRVRALRPMGRTVFLKIQDRTTGPALAAQPGTGSPDGLLQVLVAGELRLESQVVLGKLSAGDFIKVDGTITRTRTGEVTIRAVQLSLLTKAIRPQPDKYRRLADPETRYRKRYLDLMMSDEVRGLFAMRSRLISKVRSYFTRQEFIEVETPMLHVQPSGASARPFSTHHNALDLPMSLRIAPELHLKRLLVGGCERVFELNRCFRNEGLSRRHNPEFTTIEFYEAYANHKKHIARVEVLVKSLVREVQKWRTATGSSPRGEFLVDYLEEEIDFGDWRTVTMEELVAEDLGVPEQSLTEQLLGSELERRGVTLPTVPSRGALIALWFETYCERKLRNPTFVTEYPVEISPLARRLDRDPSVTARFELYIAGFEVANGFDELNDPEDQYSRFEQQLLARAAGDDEAMLLDEDYVQALEYGMPPAAGTGIGIDRLVMILLNQPSIRDVILFPHMRPEDGNATEPSALPSAE